VDESDHRKERREQRGLNAEKPRVCDHDEQENLCCGRGIYGRTNQFKDSDRDRYDDARNDRTRCLACASKIHNRAILRAIVTSVKAAARFPRA